MYYVLLHACMNTHCRYSTQMYCVCLKLMTTVDANTTTTAYYMRMHTHTYCMHAHTLQVQHPNVLRLFEVMDDPRLNKLYLVLEYMKKGDLMNVLNGDARRVVCDPMDDAGVWHIFRQVSSSIS
jgi:hypothetical protein